MVHANFESILVPEDNGKQNPNDFYTNKYQKYVACIMVINSYVLIINLVSLLNHIQVEDVVYNFVSSMIEESKYCSDLMKKL